MTDENLLYFLMENIYMNGKYLHFSYLGFYTRGSTLRLSA